MKYYFVYIMASKKDGVLYIGITNSLIRRVAQHKSRKFRGFTKEYNVHNLIYYETYGDIKLAIDREKKTQSGKICIVMRFPIKTFGNNSFFLSYVTRFFLGIATKIDIDISKTKFVHREGREKPI